MTNKESSTGIAARRSQRFSPERVVGKQYSIPLTWLPQVAAVLVSLLREIFDESAYCRFLQRNRISSSAMAYAAFREENDRLKAQRPRCC